MASAAPEYSAAPESTIDVAALKSSRFLWTDGGKPALPYRDEAGRVSLSLLRASAAAAEGLSPPQPVMTSLSGRRSVRTSSFRVTSDCARSADRRAPTQAAKWLKHAEHWLKSSGHVWSEVGDGVWREETTGEERREVGKAV